MELVTMPLSQRVASEPVTRRKARSSSGATAAVVRGDGQLGLWGGGHDVG